MIPKTCRQGDPPGDDRLTNTEQFPHMGIERRNKHNAHVMEERAEVGRRTVYSLMPAGLHGENGLSPAVGRQLIIAYVLPRMLHGLEALVLAESHVKILEDYYRGMLRDIQALRDRTANEAVYLLIGLLPIEVELHIKALTLFGAICRLPEESTLRRLAMQQLAIKTEGSKSWFMYCRRIGEMYDINIISALEYPSKKSTWKSNVALAVRTHWHSRLCRGGLRRSHLSHSCCCSTHTPTKPTKYGP